MSLTKRIEEVEAMASASTGRQDVLAGVLTETRNMVRQIDGKVDWLVERFEVDQRNEQAWRNITDRRLERVEDDILEINGGITKLNSKYDGLKKEVHGLNTKFEHLDNKVDALGRAHKALDGKVNDLSGKVDALDTKVGLLTEEVGGLKAGQIELRDMVATLLARSEGVGNPN